MPLRSVLQWKKPQRKETAQQTATQRPTPEAEEEEEAMGKLEIGDKVWVGTRDGGNRAGWAEWDGRIWHSCYGSSFSVSTLKTMIQMNSEALEIGEYIKTYVFEYMAEQLIATGEM